MFLPALLATNSTFPPLAQRRLSNLNFDALEQRCGQYMPAMTICKVSGYFVVLVLLGAVFSVLFSRHCLIHRMGKGSRATDTGLRPEEIKGGF